MNLPESKDNDQPVGEQEERQDVPEWSEEYPDMTGEGHAAGENEVVTL